MKLEHSATIQAPRERVWAFLMDVPSMASCVPGVEGVEPLDADRYRGTLKVKIGPISLALAGDIAITKRDEAAGTASMRADAADKRVGGAVKADMEMFVTPGADDSQTQLRILTDAQVLGRIGDFGQPVIRKKADQTMDEFVRNLRNKLTTA